MKGENIAFIDGQNLNKSLTWKIDYKKFRNFLKNNFGIEEAYYFLGFKYEENGLYQNLQKAGFILVFNAKPENLKSEKKGNIDVCLTFHAMKMIIEKVPGKFVLVSGDGDYKILTDYLIERKKLLKILFPNKKYASSLYNEYTYKYRYFLDWVKKELKYKNKKRES